MQDLPLNTANSVDSLSGQSMRYGQKAIRRFTSRYKMPYVRKLRTGVSERRTKTMFWLRHRLYIVDVLRTTLRRRV